MNNKTVSNPNALSGARIGVIVNKIDGVFQQSVLTGITEVAEQHGYRVSVIGLDDPAAQSIAMIRELDAVRGVVAVANAASDVLLSDIRSRGIPLSLVAHQVSGSQIPVVMANNDQGVAELVRHLAIRCQRRNILFIRGLTDQNDARERELAFRQEMLRYDLVMPETHFLRGDFIPAVAADSLRAFVRKHVSFDGILASDYRMGIAVLEELRNSGIAVPDSVSVVGFGDSAEAEAAGLTTAASSVIELGACAARQVISQIRGLRISGVTTLGVKLVVRETCGYKALDAASG